MAILQSCYCCSTLKQMSFISAIIVMVSNSRRKKITNSYFQHKVVLKIICVCKFHMMYMILITDIFLDYSCKTTY